MARSALRGRAEPPDGSARHADTDEDASSASRIGRWRTSCALTMYTTSSAKRFLTWSPISLEIAANTGHHRYPGHGRGIGRRRARSAPRRGWRSACHDLGVRARRMTRWASSASRVTNASSAAYRFFCIEQHASRVRSTCRLRSGCSALSSSARFAMPVAGARSPIRSRSTTNLQAGYHRQEAQVGGDGLCRVASTWKRRLPSMSFSSRSMPLFLLDHAAREIVVVVGERLHRERDLLARSGRAHAAQPLARRLRSSVCLEFLARVRGHDVPFGSPQPEDTPGRCVRLDADLTAHALDEMLDDLTGPGRCRRPRASWLGSAR